MYMDVVLFDDLDVSIRRQHDVLGLQVMVDDAYVFHGEVVRDNCHAELVVEISILNSSRERRVTLNLQFVLYTTKE